MLEDAWAHALAGENQDALRKAIALVEDDPMQLAAVALLGRVLVLEGRTFSVGDAAEKLAAAFVRRGDLPGAVSAARLADAAGGEGAKARKLIAEAFGKGSKRVADVSPAPPPLPAKPAIDAALAKLGSDALLDRAEKALASFVNAKDPVADGKVPGLPLFSALAPKPLERLLAAMTVRELAEHGLALEQGAEGREAFVVIRGTLRAERSVTRIDRSTMNEPPAVLAVLGPGAIFGEMALVSDAPRAAAVIAQEPAELLVITRADLEGLAANEPAIGKELGDFCRARMIANLVRHSTILRAVPPADREALMARFTARTFRAGETLVSEGDEGEGLFLIASGAVRVTKPDADGEPLILAELGPGDVVGEIGVVLRRPATASVRAFHPTVAMELTREGFAAAIRAYPTLLTELYALATEREEETRTVVGQEVLDVGDVILL
jgi:CRP-like cAMP-binding protein